MTFKQFFAADDPTAGVTVKDEQDTATSEEVKEPEFTAEQKAYFEAKLNELEKGFKAEVDRRVTPWVQKAKEAEQLLEEEQKAKMSEKEKEQFERQKMLDEMEKERLQIAAERLEFQKGQMLIKNNLGSEYLELIAGQNIEAFQANVEALKQIMQKDVEKLYLERVKEANPTPKSGGGVTADSSNPWLKEGWNVTKQMLLIKNEPEKAALLQKAAGK